MNFKIRIVDKKNLSSSTKNLKSFFSCNDFKSYGNAIAAQRSNHVKYNVICLWKLQLQFESRRQKYNMQNEGLLNEVLCL